jgi:hypothetical protein
MSLRHASIGKRIMVIPDTQVKPGVNTDHLEWAGKYAVKMKPDVIVHLGDHADFPSLSMWDKKGGKQMEGKRIMADFDAANDAWARLNAPIDKEIARLKRGKRRSWSPRRVITLGNHEDRVTRFVNSDAAWDGVIDLDMLDYERSGWEVYPYLQPVEIEGIAFVHLVCSGIMGRSITSARAGLSKRHQSFVQGHCQLRDLAETTDVMGRRQTGLIAGIFYSHDEAYLNPQTGTDNTWSGIWMLHDCKDGEFDYMPVSMNFLREKYA